MITLLQIVVTYDEVADTTAIEVGDVFMAIVAGG